MELLDENLGAISSFFSILNKICLQGTHNNLWFFFLNSKTCPLTASYVAGPCGHHPHDLPCLAGRYPRINTARAAVSSNRRSSLYIVKQMYREQISEKFKSILLSNNRKSK